MTQYVFVPTPPVQSAEEERRFHAFTRSGSVSDYDAWLEAEKARRHEPFPCDGCGVWHEQLVMGLI